MTLWQVHDLLVAQMPTSTNVCKEFKCLDEHANPAFEIAFFMWRFLSSNYYFRCFRSYSNCRNTTTVKFQEVSLNTVAENYAICRH